MAKENNEKRQALEMAISLPKYLLKFGLTPDCYTAELTYHNHYF